MSLTIIIILFVLALVLCIVEVFLVPGFGVCGVLSIACAVAGVVITYTAYGFVAGLIATAAVVIVGALLLYWVMHSKQLEKASLHAVIDSTVATEEQAQVRVGDTGVALTRLALVGNARIGSVEVEVRSASGFIEEGSPVIVTKTKQGEIYVALNKT